MGQRNERNAYWYDQKLTKCLAIEPGKEVVVVIGDFAGLSVLPFHLDFFCVFIVLALINILIPMIHGIMTKKYKLNRG